MIPILSVDETIAYENYVRQTHKIPSLLLMENVAMNCCKEIDSIDIQQKTVHIFCGTGNNGGDGFAIARLLSKNTTVAVFWYGNKDSMSIETAINFEIASTLVGVIHLQTEEDLQTIDQNASTCIDCLIGLKSTNELNGFVVNILQYIEKCRYINKIAIDVPTGVHTNTGEVHQSYFKPTEILTIGALKKGLVSGAASIELPTPKVIPLLVGKTIDATFFNKSMFENEDIRVFFPKRKKNVWKFDLGNVVVIAGSSSMLGAGVLVANSAFSIGAGLVTLISTSRHPAVKPEVMVHTIVSQHHGNMTLVSFEEMKPFLDKATVIAIGPGLGISYESKELSRRVIENYHRKVPIVVDADGLLAIDKDNTYSKNVVLTPHLGEFNRLQGGEFSETIQNYIQETSELAAQLECVIHTKGMPSITSNGKEEYWLPANAPSLATGGAGDVLTGIIAGLIAQGVEPFKAAGLGAYLQNRAAHSFEKNNSVESLTATKLIDHITF